MEKESSINEDESAGSNESAVGSDTKALQKRSDAVKVAIVGSLYQERLLDALRNLIPESAIYNIGDPGKLFQMTGPKLIIDPLSQLPQYPAPEDQRAATCFANFKLPDKPSRGGSKNRKHKTHMKKLAAKSRRKNRSSK
jgi:hypothetical protein